MPLAVLTAPTATEPTPVTVPESAVAVPTSTEALVPIAMELSVLAEASFPAAIDPSPIALALPLPPTVLLLGLMAIVD